MKIECGEICPKTGSYKIVDGAGNTVSVIYVGAGERMPATRRERCHYEPED